MSKDSARFAGGLNLYGYASNDPVNFADMTGCAPCPAGGTHFVDYVFFSVTASSPLPFVVFNPQLTYDVNGHLYAGLGIGLGTPGVSASLGAGRLHPFQPCPSSEAELENFIQGDSINGAVGYASPWGAAFSSSTSLPSGATALELAGTVGTPGPSVSVTYQKTWELF